MAFQNPHPPNFFQTWSLPPLDHGRHGDFLQDLQTLRMGSMGEKPGDGTKEAQACVSVWWIMTLT